MSEGTEHIEARLAAYVDGELSPAERADIEKYLAANPGHRKLIDELMAVKSHVTALPRSKAPVEVLDNLQSHLERQALLEDTDDSGGSMHINRWPQWTAVAAMLLLTCGLGVLIYEVLPSGEVKRDEIALAPPAIQGLPSAPILRDVGAKDEQAEFDRASPAKAASAKPDPTTPAPETVARTEAEEARRNADAMVMSKGAIPGERAPETLAAGLNGEKKADGPDGPITLNNGSVIVVSTDDPTITKNLAISYMAQNSFTYSSVPEKSLEAARAPAEGVREDANLQLAGSVMAKVKEQFKEQQAAVPNAAGSEAYLVVRNVSRQQAMDISRAIGEQRGGRQSATYLDNDELYPDLARQRYANLATHSKQGAMNDSQSNKAEFNFNSNVQNQIQNEVAPVGGAGGNQVSGLQIGQPMDQQQMRPQQSVQAPAAVPTSQSAQILEGWNTDVLIVVQPKPETTATTQPSEVAEPTTSPATAPAAVVPNANEAATTQPVLP